MQQLFNKRTQLPLTTRLELAAGMNKRMKGLMGVMSLKKGQALWIPGCNWIHTCFMKFSIDAIFLNSDMKVVDIFFDIKPWRLCKPVFRARSVVEFQTGDLDKTLIRVGDQLYVGS